MLHDLIPDYTISSGQTAEALVIKKLNDLEPIDFRMYFRVSPPSETDLRLFLKEEKVNLLDISIGGAKFICSKNYFFRPRDPVKFKLLIGDAVLISTPLSAVSNHRTSTPATGTFSMSASSSHRR